MGWGSCFCEIFFKIFIRLSPIWSLCICVGPVWHSNHVLRLFHLCSCIVHLCCGLLHAKCLTKCSSDILWCIGLKWVPVLGVTLDWTCLPCFSQRVCVLHIVPILCHASHLYLSRILYPKCICFVHFALVMCWTCNWSLRLVFFALHVRMSIYLLNVHCCHSLMTGLVWSRYAYMFYSVYKPDCTLLANVRTMYSTYHKLNESFFCVRVFRL